MTSTRALPAVLVAALIFLLAAAAAPAQDHVAVQARPREEPVHARARDHASTDRRRLRRAVYARQAPAPKIDCFYVYPTVSDQKTAARTCTIDPEERSIALYQAARYSQHCRVYAPMYRQVTLPAC